MYNRDQREVECRFTEVETDTTRICVTNTPSRADPGHRTSERALTRIRASSTHFGGILVQGDRALCGDRHRMSAYLRVILPLPGQDGREPSTEWTRLLPTADQTDPRGSRAIFRFPPTDGFYLVTQRIVTANGPTHVAAYVSDQKD